MRKVCLSIMVNLGQELLTTENLISAIRTGRFIATQGPWIPLSVPSVPQWEAELGTQKSFL